jgi:hypothetical protein
MRSIFGPKSLLTLCAIGAIAVTAAKLDNPPTKCLAVANPCDSSGGLDTTYMTMDPNVQKTVVGGE